MKKKFRYKGSLWLHFNWPLLIIILFALMNIGAYIYDVKSGLMMTCFLVVYVVTTLIFYMWNRSKFVTEMISFGTQYSTIQKKLLNDFEIPYALLESSGKVLWVNEQFSLLTGVDKKYHKSVSTIFPAITREFLEKNEETTDVLLEHEDRVYRISLSRVMFEELLEENAVIEPEDISEHLIALYLFDETLLHQYEKEIEEEKQVAALVYIDDYEEALNSIEDVKRSLLTALVDRKVNQYFANVDALVRKMEKDKYFVVFKQKYLKQLEEDKFSLLEDVKTIKVGNEMAVTLSIGVGVKEGSYNENYEYARAAIDLALGRGGDQAVVKNRGQIHYYGGKAKQVERNTRVKARVKQE